MNTTSSRQVQSLPLHKTDHHRYAYMVRRIVVELVNKLEYLTKLLGESHEKK